MKKLTLIVLACLSLVACKEQSKSQVRHIQIGDQHLCIPEIYLSYPEHKYEGKEKYVSLSAMLPDMRPLENSWTELAKQGRHQELIRFGVGEISGRTPHEFGLWALEKNSVLEKEEYGLEFYTTPNDYHNQDGDEPHLSRNKDGTIRTVIFCTRDDFHERHSNPHGNRMCRHRFMDYTFKYRIDYRKERLPEWNVIESNLITKINKFRVETPQGDKKQCQN